MNALEHPRRPVSVILVAVREGSDPLTYGDQENTDRPDGSTANVVGHLQSGGAVSIVP
jgi:hypothetical protein